MKALIRTTNLAVALLFMGQMVMAQQQLLESDGVEVHCTELSA
jgi:hypothetical protein